MAEAPARNVMAERLEAFLIRHGPGGPAHWMQAELAEHAHVLLGKSLVAILEDAREDGATARADELLREHAPGWERSIKYARQWLSLWKLEQGTDESN